MIEVASKFLSERAKEIAHLELVVPTLEDMWFRESLFLKQGFYEEYSGYYILLDELFWAEAGYEGP